MNKINNIILIILFSIILLYNLNVTESFNSSKLEEYEKTINNQIKEIQNLFKKSQEKTDQFKSIGKKKKEYNKKILGSKYANRKHVSSLVTSAGLAK